MLRSICTVPSTSLRRTIRACESARAGTASSAHSKAASNANLTLSLRRDIVFLLGVPLIRLEHESAGLVALSFQGRNGATTWTHLWLSDLRTKAREQD